MPWLDWDKLPEDLRFVLERGGGANLPRSLRVALGMSVGEPYWPGPTGLYPPHPLFDDDWYYDYWYQHNWYNW